MRITLGAIKEILTGYNNKQNRHLELPDNLLREIKQYFEESYDLSRGTPEEVVIDMYEEILLECEHDDYDICEDEEDKYNGQGDYLYSQKYQYAVCRICGATCPIQIVATDEGFDQEKGSWER